MTVGEKIRKFRIDQGYTQKELAIMSGLSCLESMLEL